MDSSFSRDGVIDWLLGSLSLEASVFHAGRYCGAWQASTAGRLLGSFHLVLDGRCWLHRPGQAPLALGARDGVLFLRDVPHHLGPDADPRAHAAEPRASMVPLGTVGAGGTGLACGFFQFRGGVAGLLMDGLPDMVVLRADEPGSERVATLFEFVQAEAGGDPDRPSPLLARLVELLFFYAIRRIAARGTGPAGLWALARAPEMAPLLEGLLDRPGQAWSVEQMAAHVHMSRSNFCRRFGELCGQSPAAFLTVLRMHVAAQRLESGESIERAADHVGYRSSAAFSRAFKKATGAQPGAWRRGGRQAGARVLQ
ncbi:MAG: RCS-specific HTH-type transcriptional activator RclR [Paracidovorax wautersii]|uniref:RCS-specific HTH-type transcriptional activator RclR n=1 Tax=Paracidovorax wautersii TaxID=1177982 RepID=A0A7V8JQS5_9BURK|nr:MAG: RCS-specific HTH-type transcriptional activator RclR [Paracidovorax wautersii]